MSQPNIPAECSSSEVKPIQYEHTLPFQLMNTPSHFLITAAIEKAFPRVPIVKGAFLLGSVAPDLPLWLLSVGGAVYYRLMLGWDAAATAHQMFDNLYFYNPVWVGLHNFLHAPLILLTGIGLVWRTRRNIGSQSRWCFWFFLACLLHSTIDILTHVDDGPLLLFPLNWTLRFHSPVSYWDDRYYGDQFQKFELGLDLVLISYLLMPQIHRCFRKRRKSEVRF